MPGAEPPQEGWRPSGRKRPAGGIANAAHVVRIAAGEIEDTAQVDDGKAARVAVDETTFEILRRDPDAFERTANVAALDRIVLPP